MVFLFSKLHSMVFLFSEVQYILWFFCFLRYIVWFFLFTVAHLWFSEVYFMVFLHILWFIQGRFLVFLLMNVHSMIFQFSYIDSMVCFLLLEVLSMVFSFAALCSAVLSSLTWTLVMMSEIHPNPNSKSCSIWWSFSSTELLCFMFKKTPIRIIIVMWSHKTSFIWSQIYFWICFKTTAPNVYVSVHLVTVFIHLSSFSSWFSDCLLLVPRVWWPFHKTIVLSDSMISTVFDMVDCQRLARSDRVLHVTR